MPKKADDGQDSPRARILLFVREYQQAHGRSPSIQEIADACDIKSKSTTYYHVLRLSDEGQLSRIKGQPRSISLTEQLKECPGCHRQISADFEYCPHCGWEQTENR